MFKSFFVTTVLLMKLTNCSNPACEVDTTDEPPTRERSQFDNLRTLFRFACSSSKFYHPDGIPYQYYVPRTDLKFQDSNEGHISVPRKNYFQSRRMRVSTQSGGNPAVPKISDGRKRLRAPERFDWKLASTTRKLTDLELENFSKWKRDCVPLNRLMLSLESPIFLGKYFYALTSLTEVNGRSTLSRFYYAPVLTARYSRKQDGSNGLEVTGLKLNVFSICLEPSEAPEDVTIPLVCRPQQIIDAGLRRATHNAVYDVEAKLRENSTAKLNMAEDRVVNERWDTIFPNKNAASFRQLPKHPSPYAIINTPCGPCFEVRPARGRFGKMAFHQYDIANEAYIFAHGTGDRNNLIYDGKGAELLIFLNPDAHFKDERKMWDMCVELWKEEMLARYGPDAKSRLVHPHAYLDKNASTAAYEDMLPRYEAMGECKKLISPRRVGHPVNPSNPRMSQQQSSLKNPRKQAANDMQNDSELSGANGKPETRAGSEVPVYPKLSLKRHSPAGKIPKPSGSIDVGKLTDESSDVLPESAAGCSYGPNTPETSGLSNGGLGGLGGLLFPGVFSNIGAHPSVPLFGSSFANPALSEMPGPQQLCASLPTTGSPLGLAPQLALPQFTEPPIVGPEDMEIVNTLTSMQRAALGAGNSASTTQQPVELMEFTEALDRLSYADPTSWSNHSFLALLARLSYADPTLWSNPSFLALLSNPVVFASLLGYLTMLNGQAGGQ